MFKKDHPLYHTWSNMLSRCEKPYATNYLRYGGRGIRVCERWHDFWLFAADVGEKPTPAHTLDRLDNNGDYTPDNFKWSTPEEQQRNTRRTLFVDLGGDIIPAHELAKKVGVSTKTIRERISRGLPIDKVTSPEKLYAPIARHVVEKAWEKRRAQTHCKRGHEFTPENTYTDKKGCRCCRICVNAKTKRWRDKMRSQGNLPL